MPSLEVERDERTVVVEQASYRWGYLFLSLGILVSVMYRSYIRREASWDLLALVILSGVVTTAYQLRHQVLTGRSVRVGVFVAGVALAVAAILVLLGRR